MKEDGKPEEVRTSFSIQTLRSDDYVFTPYEAAFKQTRHLVVVHRHEHGETIHGGAGFDDAAHHHFDTEHYQYHHILGDLHAHKAVIK